MSKKIFISIASFCDNDLKNTILSILENANQPDLLIFGICLQNNDERRSDSPLYDYGVLPYHETDRDKFGLTQNAIEKNQLRILNLHYTEALGPCYARYLCSKLYDGEDFYLQLDSHLRFVKDWDRKLLDMYADCTKRFNTEKIILSTYSRAMTEYAMYLKGEIQDCEVPVMSQGFILKNGLIRWKGAALKRCELETEYIVHNMLAGGFMFSHGDLIKDVPFDPFLYDCFDGEEILYSARCFTHGYIGVNPNVNIMFHDYIRENAPRFWELPLTNGQNGLQRVLYILGLAQVFPIELNKALNRFGLGQSKTINEFWSAIGINWSHRIVYKNFATGIVTKPDFEL